MPSIGRIRKKASIKLFGYKEDVCYTQNMLFPRMWNDRLAASYKGWSGGGANEATHTKREPDLFHHIPTQLHVLCAISYGILSDGRMIFKEAVNRNTATGLQEFPGLIICDLGDQKLLPESLRAEQRSQCVLWLTIIIRITRYLLAMDTWKKRQAAIQCLIFPFLYDGIGYCALSESDSRTTP